MTPAAVENLSCRTNAQSAGSALILRADARALPLADCSVDLIVTSPPYFGLRSYTDGGEHYDGQIGSEETPAEFTAALLACTREWMRVLKPTGSMFVDLGDSYYSGRGAPGKTTVDAKNLGRTARRAGRSPLDRSDLGYPRKSLLLMPERYRIACLDDLGLTVRAVMVWEKLNALPESVTDRVRRSHEDWVHLTMGPRYFASVDEIREPSDPRNLRPSDLAGRVSAKDAARRSSRLGAVGHPGVPLAFNPLGKLPGSVWAIASEPLKVPAELGVDHFAAFPMEWPRRLIRGWSPSGYCTECDEPRRPTYNRDFAIQDDCSPDTAFKRDKHYAGNNWRDKPRGSSMVSRAGEACACPAPTAPTRPAVVLDPFGGTGTTALVARAYGRIGISVDMSADYCRIARWRTTDPGEIAKALGVAKPPSEVEGQGELFGPEMDLS
jgi:DNA modification methylase